MSKIKPKFMIVLVSIIIVISILGWVLFFFVSITGKIVFERIPPVDSDYSSAFVIIPPDEPGLSPEEVAISGCEGAKLIRKFVCSIYEEKYPQRCSFFSGKCKGMLGMCVLAQENVEEKCSVSSG